MTYEFTLEGRLSLATRHKTSLIDRSRLVSSSLETGLYGLGPEPFREMSYEHLG